MIVENNPKERLLDFENQKQETKNFASFHTLFIFANISELGFCLVDAGNKELMGNRGVSHSSVCLIQPIMNIVLTTVAIACSKESISGIFRNIEAKDYCLLTIISLSSAIAIYSINLALLALPMAIVIATFGTVPFISALLARLFLRENLDWLTILAMIISFVAILILSFGKDEV